MKKSIRRRVGRSYRGASLAERREARRAQLVRAGIDTFGARGFHAVTVREVCAAAGLTERYFYESFADRAQLFSAAYEQLHADLQQRLGAAFAAGGRDLARAARSGLHAYFEHIRRDPRGARIMLIEVFGVSADMDRLSRQTAMDFTVMTERMLAPRLRGKGLDPGLLATALVGGVIFSAMRWVLSGYAQPLDAVVDSVSAVFAAVLQG
ncbi:MAG TPA: TetR/AcrR family transcriptional regulator [Verrucomicrobiae bacterium]|nr:TetR/AcrR family transcriptional regulator [Verrucomicrobiae bacterium]